MKFPVYVFCFHELHINCDKMVLWLLHHYSNDFEDAHYHIELQISVVHLWLCKDGLWNRKAEFGLGSIMLVGTMKLQWTSVKYMQSLIWFLSLSSVIMRGTRIKLDLAKIRFQGFLNTSRSLSSIPRTSPGHRHRTIECLLRIQILQKCHPLSV